MTPMKSTHLRGITRAYLMSISFWYGISLLMGWQFGVLNQQNVWPSFLDFLTQAGTRAFTFALWTPPIFFLVGKYLGPSKKRIRYVLLWVFGAVPFELLLTAIQAILMPTDHDLRHRYVSRFMHSWREMIRSGFADEIFIYIAIVVAAHAYEYFQQARRRALEASEFERALAVSELQALKMQLHPHFLFNTLNGISSLVVSDPERARAMIVKLSGLLRTALRKNDTDLIPLREELKFIEEYLELEKMRLGVRLTVSLQINPDTLPLLVPHLVLQPLVENAIRHGIASSREKGWIEISSIRKNHVYELRVRNSVGNRRPSGTGVGLRNTEARLHYLYSKEASFSFVFEDNGNAAATLILPALGEHRPPHIEGRLDPIEIEVQGHAGIDR
jgi:two-component system, LytTR family, sensor kinase